MATAAELRRLREEQSIFAPLYEAARQQQSELAAQGRRPVFGGLLSKEPVYGTDTLRYEGIGNMLAGLLSPAAKAVDAPISAYRGTIPQEDMISEALGVGGLAMAGGGAVGVPRGAVGANALRVYHGGPKKISPEDVEMRFDPEGTPIGFSVTDNPDVAEYYKNMRGGGSISEFDIDLDKANIISDIELYEFIDDLENKLDADASYEQIQRGLLDAGIDAIEYADPEFGIRVVNPSILAANASKSTGLLTTAASEAQDMAKRILDLRAQGRASEVTDEMMAQADPQYMFANTPLPMDEASRMARAEAAGFENQTYYHGAKDAPELPYFDRIDEYNTEGHAGTIYGTSSPAVANTYVRRSNIGIDEGAIYPLLARRDPNDPTINVGGVYSRIPMSIRDEKGQRLIDVLPEAAEMDHLNAERVTSTDAIASAMRDADFSMLRMENVVDRGPYYPDATPLGFEVRSYKDIERQNDFNKWNKETLAEANEPATNIMVQDPTKLRSRFARFDPEFAHLSNLSAANVSPIGGLLAQSGANQQSGPVAPNLIDEYLKSLQARR